MNRKAHIKEFLEGMHLMQQKILSRHKLMTGIEGVTFSQWRVLEIIDEQKHVTIKDIHTALSISSSAATQLVNELEKKKYVCREDHPDDRRASSIALSEKTKGLLKRFKDEHAKVMLEIVEVLNDTEFEQFISLHKKIIHTITSKK